MDPQQKSHLSFYIFQHFNSSHLPQHAHQETHTFLHLLHLSTPHTSHKQYIQKKMGNYRFRLSDMIPNAWFYKLKDMSSHNSKNQHHHHHKTTNKKSHTPSSPIAPPNNHPPEITKVPHLSDQRKSYYFTRDLTSHPNSPPTEPPRRSSRRRRIRPLRNRQPEPRLVSSTTSAGCICRATLESVFTKPPPGGSQTSSSDDHGSIFTERGSDRGLIPDDASDDLMLSSCKCRTAGNDAVNTNMDGNYNRVSDDLDHHDLPPIITKKQHQEPAKIHRRTSADELSEETTHGSLSVKVVKENFSSPVCRRSVSGNSSLSPGGVKLRRNTPKIANRRIQGRKSASSRRSVSESFAVVKSSEDPGRDFKESMVEMIVENNIRASKDLEELLACYLSLNSDEYHDLIINVFKQIWFDVIRLRLHR